MGLYVWIALGAVVGVVSRTVAIRLVNSEWLEAILMGIAGAVVGGWIGARIRGVSGIEDMSILAMIAAVVGSGLLDSVYLFTRQRQVLAHRRRLEEVDVSGRKAA